MTVGTLAHPTSRASVFFVRHSHGSGFCSGYLRLMKRNITLTFLIACCVCCKKDAAKPAPDLTGQWLQTEQHFRLVDAKDSVMEDYSLPGNTTLTLTATEYKALTTASSWTPYTIIHPYTRSGNTITVGPNSLNLMLTIEDLTTTALTLRDTRHYVNTQGVTHTTDYKYTRQ